MITFFWSSLYVARSFGFAHRDILKPLFCGSVQQEAHPEFSRPALKRDVHVLTKSALARIFTFTGTCVDDVKATSCAFPTVLWWLGGSTFGSPLHVVSVGLFFCT